MNERIQKLRLQSLNAEYKISAERALLVTEFYKTPSNYGYSVPVQRALCFKYILENKKICILENELIVGERGPAPKATPTYPEVNLHTIEDLKVLDSRQKVFFKVDSETIIAYRDIIIPFWQGRSHRERMLHQMDESWLDAYAAGVFTEFQEQRAPGHTVLGDKIYKQGMLEIITEIERTIEKLDFFNDPEAYSKREELRAMAISAEALIIFARRHADVLDSEGRSDLAEICRRVPAYSPRNFHEALQYYWFVHLGVITELNPWDSFNPGRLDQHLFPFYQGGLEEGTLSKESAKELLEAFWIKFNNHPSPPKVGITALESNTYTDFALINLGGLKEDGTNAVNELSFLMLDVIEEMRLVQPSSMIQLSNRNPDNFLHRALNIVKTGFGQPSIFNTDAIVEELVRQGKSIEDARNGGASGCVESGAFGTEAYFLTGYFNITKILEITLYNGIDILSGKLIGLRTGDPKEFSSFEMLMNAFKSQLNYFIDIKIKGNNIIEQLFSVFLPVPFLSTLIEDCISKGKDYNSGGARYNTSYIQGVGLGSVTDCLASLKYNVFDKQHITIEEILKAMKNDFIGYEGMRFELIRNSPKYGNDDDTADDHARKVFELFYDSVNGRPTVRGGTFRINLLPTTSHVYFGSKIGAMPDGRKAYEPLSEGISPVQGADLKGPTAVLKSAAKIDQLKTGGTLLNQKFTPSFFKDEQSILLIASLVRAYFKMDGHHIQFNVVSADILREAQKYPEKFRDLIVRVAGYSDYFNDLGEDLQNEIIRRTEHNGPV